MLNDIPSNCTATVSERIHVSREADMETPEFRVVILGAGRGFRGDLPPAMVPIGNEGRLLDWLLTAFSHLPGLEVDFVSGFMAQEVMKQYKNLHFHHNLHWSRTGPAKSLSLAPLSSGKRTFICYSDVVFRPETVYRMEAEDADLVVAIDRRWKVRYDGRSASELKGAEKVKLADGVLSAVGRGVSTSKAYGEFAGLIMLSGKIAKRLQNVLASTIFKDPDGLPEVISFLLQHGIDARVVDVDGEWAELNAPQDLARFVLGTKAESLARLRPLVKSGYIGDLLPFTYQQWERDREGVLSAIHESFPDNTVIARSSALSEDSWQQSLAGVYKSIPNLSTRDRRRLGSAIDEVFQSYGNDLPEHQILIQKMLTGVRMSGVVMTRTHGHGAPYFVVNYDDSSTRTDTVTSGEGGNLKTLFLHRGECPRPDTAPGLAGVIEAVSELEGLVGHDSLDIEFAVSEDDQVHILQVRPIAISRDNLSMNDAAIQAGIRDAQSYFQELQKPSPFVVGRFTQLSVMSDWNPAEIIGTKPTPLAFSLYRYIITDETWARQRAEYGYRDVRPCNLLVDILGHPYVDVRATFNSFIPATLDDSVATRLVEHHLEHLAKRPELHDKVEFDILFTCWTFDIDERLKRLSEAGFGGADIAALKNALLEITKKGIKRCRFDYKALERVNDRCTRIRSSKISPLKKTYLHLENAREHGALHFSHLARAAFVAVSLLRAMVRSGILAAEQEEAFLGSLRTVSTALQEDARRVASGNLPWEDFVELYGHLRPGTYDINSSRYGAAPKEFLQPIVDQAGTEPTRAASFTWDRGTIERVERELSGAGLKVRFAAFEKFLRLAIEGREYGKFIFTRDLSAALESLAEFGAAHFVSREELSYLRIHDLLKFLSSDFESPSVAIHELKRKGRDAVRVHQAVCLPDQIFSADDIACFEYRKATPNYVTRKTVRAPIVSLDHTSSPDTDLEGRIVLIPNADPGFDWIFSRRIAGLITMYGGVNSHMAIRMAEFQLPGVTGLGELLFERIRRAKVLELDCSGRQVRFIHA